MGHQSLHCLCLISLALKEAGFFLIFAVQCLCFLPLQRCELVQPSLPWLQTAVTSVRADPGTVGPGIAVPMGIPLFGQFPHVSGAAVRALQRPC